VYLALLDTNGKEISDFDPAGSGRVEVPVDRNHWIRLGTLYYELASKIQWPTVSLHCEPAFVRVLHEDGRYLITQPLHTATSFQKGTEHNRPCLSSFVFAL
jgi:hypothetical protein